MHGLGVGLDPAAYGTHTLRRTRTSLIYRRTKNLRAVQILLGQSKLESTVRYLGIEVDDALEMAEQTRVWSCTRVSDSSGSLAGLKPPLMAAVSLSRNRTVAEMLQRERATDCQATLKAAIVP
jgi:hypothetical protein